MSFLKHMSKSPSYKYIKFYLSTFAQEHLWFSQFLPIMNKIAMSIVEQLSFWYNWASFGYIHKSNYAKTWGRLIVNFLRSCHIDFQSGCTSLLSQKQWRSVPLTLAPHQHKTVICVIFLCLSDFCKMEPQSSFNLHFPYGQGYWTFSVPQAFFSIENSV